MIRLSTMVGLGLLLLVSCSNEQNIANQLVENDIALDTMVFLDHYNNDSVIIFGSSFYNKMMSSPNMLEYTSRSIDYSIKNDTVWSLLENDIRKIFVEKNLTGYCGNFWPYYVDIQDTIKVYCPEVKFISLEISKADTNVYFETCATKNRTLIEISVPIDSNRIVVYDDFVW